MKNIIKNKLFGKYFKDINLDYKVNCKNGFWEIIFTTEIPSSKIMEILGGALNKMKVEGDVDLNDIEAWSADERYHPKLLKKLNKYIDTIEKRIRKDSDQPGFKFATRKIKYADFKKQGSIVKAEILTMGDYVL